MRVVPALLVLCLALLGCERTRVITVTDAGPACGEGENLVNGQCRFVCTRDGECAAGERCNLLTGTCEAKPPPVDSGVVLIPCTEGAVRCSVDNAAVERCDATGTFTTMTQCPQPEGYCQNERCLACRPGATKCGAGGNTVERCLDDGSAWVPTTCAAGATCVSGECRECNPGQKRCSTDGKTLEECQRLTRPELTYGYQPAGDNFDGSCVTQVCETVAGTAQCRAPACLPGAQQCLDSTTQQVCSATGAWTNVACSSLPGFSAQAECVNGTCIDECADAARQKSYFGCEYWTTVMDNVNTPAVFKGGLTAAGVSTNDSEFAFVVANNSALPTTVTISRWNGSSVVVVKTVSVPGRNDPATKGIAQIKVPWAMIAAPSGSLGVSGRARYAYRLTSTRPVTVYQFNPLSAVGRVGSCNNANQCNLQSSQLGPQCIQNVCNYYSYSNDASLLLPAHILGTSYVALTPEHIVGRVSSSTGTPSSAFNGTISIVSPQDNTQVTVRASARTLAGAGGVTAMTQGETRTFTLAAYEVLQLTSDMPTGLTSGSSTGNLQCVNDPYDPLCSFLFCDQLCRVANGDLTGTIITSDLPIAVFGGSACTLRGPGDSACDHVEEQLFPFVTWGKNFVAGRTAPLRLTNNQFATAANAGPDYYKIVAGCPDSACPTGTLLTLSTPPAAADVLANAGGCESGTSLQANNCRLRGGRFIEFRSKTSFTISANQPIQVAQMFAGQNATTGTTRPSQGDPSLVLLPPVEQWRTSYTVLTAPGTRDNYLGIVIDGARVANVRVDGSLVPMASFAAIANSTFKVANVPVQVGSHTVAVEPVPNQTALPGAGVTVYGFDEYVSYGYTGGLDLTTIVTGVNPGG